jgi:hypothetical protein
MKTFNRTDTINAVIVLLAALRRLVRADASGADRKTAGGRLI